MAPIRLMNSSTPIRQQQVTGNMKSQGGEKDRQGGQGYDTDLVS
jgi:hypothetical protein